MSVKAAVTSGRTPEETFGNWRKKALFLAKRGNIESELLIVAYVESLDQMPSTQQSRLLEQFLHENDQNLFCWLMKFNPKAPHEDVTIPKEYQSLIDEIRANYLIQR